MAIDACTKTMNIQDIYNKTVIHYANLAEVPAFLEHARFMVKELMKDQSGLFQNLGQDVKQEIDKRNAQKIPKTAKPTDPST